MTDNSGGRPILLLLISEGGNRWKSVIYDSPGGTYDAQKIDGQAPQFWEGKMQTCMNQAQRFYEDQGYLVVKRATAR